jgi:hypothetical protein
LNNYFFLFCSQIQPDCTVILKGTNCSTFFALNKKWEDQQGKKREHLYPSVAAFFSLVLYFLSFSSFFVFLLCEVRTERVFFDRIKE